MRIASDASRNYLEKQQGKGLKLLWKWSEPTSTVTGQQPLYATETPEIKTSQGSPIAKSQSNIETLRSNNDDVNNVIKRMRSICRLPERCGGDDTI